MDWMLKVSNYVGISEKTKKKIKTDISYTSKLYKWVSKIKFCSQSL